MATTSVSVPKGTVRNAHTAQSITTGREQTKKMLREGDKYQKLSRDPEQEATLGSAAVQAMQESKPMNFFVAFILLLPSAMLLDVIDLLDLSGVGAVVAFLVSFILGTFISFFAWVAGGKGTVQTIIAIAGYVVELIPFIGILPVTSICVVLAYIASLPQFREKMDKAAEASQVVASAIETGKKVEKVVSTIKLKRAG